MAIATVFIPQFSFDSSVAAAATKGTADALVAHASGYVGDKYNTFGVDAHRWISYYCDCGKVCWKNKNGTCKYCGGKTDNLISVYTKTSASPNPSADNDGSYKWAETIKSGSGSVYCMYYNNKATSSFSSKSTKVNVIYLWKASTFTKPVYRMKTVTYSKVISL